MSDKEENGALWEGKTKYGDLYFSGFIDKENGERQHFVAFTNKAKVSKKQPDFKIYFSNKKKETE